MRIINRIIIDERKPLEKEGYLLLQGLPGIGFVGLTAAEFFIEEFEHELAFSLLPYDSRPVAYSEGEGYLVSLIDELYVYEITDERIKKPLLIFTGKRQPEASIYDTIIALLDYVKSKVSDVVAIGGMSGVNIELGAFTYDEKIAKRLEENNVPALRHNTFMNIAGAVAILPRIAIMKGIRARGLLSKVSERLSLEELPPFTTLLDPIASKKAVALINKVYDLGIEDDLFEFFERKNEIALKAMEEMRHKYIPPTRETSMEETDEDKYYV